MNNKIALSIIVAASCMLAATQAIAEETKVEETASTSEEVDASPLEITKLIDEGSAYISSRYRFEHVDQDSIANNAKASTLRTRLGFNTGTAYGFKAKLEFEDVSELGADSYNNTINSKTDYPVVADPDGTELNQAWLSYEGIPSTVIRGGREALKIDDLRFVGDVGWRQNNQTFDGVNVSNTSVEDLKLFYGFVGNVNRIFGEDSEKGDFDTKLNLFNISYSGLSLGTITTYAYLFDVEDAPALSSSTLGVRVNGSRELSDSLKLLYDLQYAYQQDYENNPINYNTQYYHTQVGLGKGGFVVKGGFESLGSDDGNIAFSTPFATLHKFNGWADKFLTTPEGGLQDAYGLLSYSMEIEKVLEKLSLTAVYHYFSSEENSAKYGSEWDFDLTAVVCPGFSMGVKYALYDSANFSTDTEKLILSALVSLN